MAFEYGQEIDPTTGDITHAGSWGAKSIPKDAMARIIENLRLVYDEPTAGTTAALALKANASDVNTTLALKAPIASPTFTGTVTAPTFSGNLTGNAATASDIKSAIENNTLAFPINNFRTTVFGSNNRGTHAKPFRVMDVLGVPDNSGFAWGVGDTHGFIHTQYGDAKVFVGGGNGDVITWYKQLATTDAVLPLTGGTLAGSLTVPTIYAGNWFRSTGDTGWYNTTYQGGWHMTDTDWIRAYNDKDVYTKGVFQAYGGFNGKLNGCAATLGSSGNNTVPMTFNWSGQDGQPTWLWGGSDGTNMYVYNPSNFNVYSVGGYTAASFAKTTGDPTANTNCDDTSLLTGMYYTAAGTLPPGVAYASLFNYRYSNLVGRQMIIEFNNTTTNPRLYIRSLQEGIWYPWKLIG